MLRPRAWWRGGAQRIAVVSPFRRDSGRRQVSVFEDGARVHGNTATRARGGRRGLVRDGRDELELTAMADAHGAVACSLVAVTVAVMLATVIACMTYGDTQPRLREVGEALVVAGH